MVVYRNTSHVRCQCQRLGTFGVLMDSSHREVSGLSQSWPIYPKSRTNAIFLCEQQLEGDLETLGLVTYCTLCLSMLALILTVLVLSCLRGLKSNTRSIHSNTAAAMFLSELVFLLGINQTEQQVACVFLYASIFDYYQLLSRPERHFSLFLLLSHKPVEKVKIHLQCVEICAHSAWNRVNLSCDRSRRTVQRLDSSGCAGLFIYSASVSVPWQRACAGRSFCICSALLISCT